MPATVRHVTRISSQTTLCAARAASHAQLSSNACVNRAPAPGPRHRRNDHPTPPTLHPRRRRLQEHHHRAGIQRPPPTHPTARVIPPAPPTAPRAPRPRCTGRANRDHQHLLVGALLTLEPKPINRRPFDTKDLPPYPGCAHTVPCPVSGYRPWWPLSNVFRSPPSFTRGAVTVTAPAPR